MNLEIFVNSPLVQNLGWTLLHSLWQGAIVAAWLWIILKFASRASANFRYLVACAALFLMLLLPAVTFVWLSNSTGETAKTIQIGVIRQSAARRAGFRDPEILASEEISRANYVNRAPQKAAFSLAKLQTLISSNLNQFLPFLVFLWLIGAFVFAARTIGGVWHLRVLRRAGISHLGGDWQKRFADLCGAVGVNRAVALFESSLVTAPVVIGWLKPVILVPSGAFLGLAPSQIEAILAHELMHIRRHDFLVNALQTATEILLFYHPCAWWISARIRVLREFACDDAVVGFYGEKLTYARALLNLEQLRQTANQTNPQLSLAANGGKLMHRIKRIIEPQTGKTRSTVFSTLAASLILLALGAGIFFGSGNLSNVAASAKNKASKRTLAVGFVSLPPVDRINPPQDADATMRLLIEKLKSHKVPAIGFVQGGMISDGEKFYPVRAEMVRTWRDAGFEIGIGGYKHIKFYDTPYEDYVANVEKNERITRQLLSEKGAQQLRYFSYPYLNTGKSAEDKARFENWLAARGIRPVKYTFDNQEWMYSFAYDAARKDNDVPTMKEIRAEFLDYMTKMLAHYEAYSQETFGRDIPQTLVLTSSRLVTDTADEFFGMLEKRGYNFIPMDEALADEAYKTPENFVGSAGISWFERWTMARGGKLREEPKVNEFIQRIWDETRARK